ncbi:hypothetical protein A2V56_00315 [Candidatus Woesebacteria bacterium RBG_19FT_COMBO_42_9]|uniref:Probable peptidoglycan glycosyltransferase FtsW n=1 Tax=Candidatus Woesebacteria bacterium RBG_16_42_24 TaxID=1802485 RepID=A0A1F7XJG8_9BACT|nr:MAG: hypothetical protein A2V97_00300 [Candidatus Woesebacteria bacterium RBG_16_42_24]OGM17449.1 MAG: hypothetical protein A2V56_00315 [Candidatus Woesebacteria bacterium RBG_19FT_COMBO_42_9]
MKGFSISRRFDYILLFAAIFLVVFGVVNLRSLAPSLFPVYFLYLALAVVAFIIFSHIDFEILSLFSKHLYILSILLLLAPLLIGQVTRGAIRWIPIGPLTIQPAEIVRPLLIIYFANYLTSQKIDLKRFINTLILLTLPAFLILVQPSLGVAILTLVGFIGVVLASEINKKLLLFGGLILIVIVPLAWQALAPYQKARIITFINPGSDPYGAGYNSLQAMISVGSGKLTGRGLGRGVQTQLAFLPERHTDFIFASIAEEMGLVGAGLILVGLFAVFWRISSVISDPRSFAARAYTAGIFLTLFAQTFVHIGMNMGILPITGVPLPLVSGGGSSLLATSISLAIVTSCRKQIQS